MGLLEKGVGSGWVAASWKGGGKGCAPFLTGASLG